MRESKKRANLLFASGQLSGFVEVLLSYCADSRTAYDLLAGLHIK